MAIVQPQMSVLAPDFGFEFFDMQDGAENAVHHQTVALQQVDMNTRITQLEARMVELRDMGILRASPPVQQAKPGLFNAPMTPSSPPEIKGTSYFSESKTATLPLVNGNLSTMAMPETRVDSDVSIVTSQTDVTARVMSIIQGYGQNEENSEGKAWLGSIHFEPRVRAFIEAKLPVDLVLPAFPWKSVNKVDKVLGATPDLGEELGLGRLQHLCEDIQDIYPPGAYVTITSDGLVYNDLLGISDEEVYEYGLGLREMALQQGYDRLRFIRIMNLLGLTDNPHLTKEEYLAATSASRELLVEKYLPADFDVHAAILNDTDIKLTYCGYLIFLAKDLRYSPVKAGVEGKNEYRRLVKRVAQDMITRGKAFARAIEDALPQSIRLSIHRSIGLTKLAFPLVPQPNHFSMTPWHCSIAVTADGQFRTAHACELRDKYDLILNGDQPYYFRQRSDLWEWEVPVDFHFFYPRGVHVQAKVKENEPAPRFGPAESAKLKALGKVFKTVITTGFS